MNTNHKFVQRKYRMITQRYRLIHDRYRLIPRRYGSNMIPYYSIPLLKKLDMLTRNIFLTTLTVIYYKPTYYYFYYITW